jgi:cytochrome c556
MNMAHAQQPTIANGRLYLRGMDEVVAIKSTPTPGLYRVVREFQAVSPDQLARVGELPEVAKTPELVDAMVAIDERFDALKAVQNAGWKTPHDHPDLNPVREATQLWEYFRELARTEDTAKRPHDYRNQLADSQKAMEALRLGLRDAAPNFPALDAAMKQVGQNCAACHKTFRNEKK